MEERPLILVDVDGVLNPFRRPGTAWQSHTCTAAGVAFALWLNPDHGPRLLALARETGADLVWATTWEHDANAGIGPIIGLPELPVIEVHKGRGLEDPGCCWKIPSVAEYVNRRPFVWFDDGLGRIDRLWLEAHPNVDRFRLLHIGGNRGIRDAHFRQARDWLTSAA
ncbi:HAD domain-containing protein [Herbidospora mongoliensis]|uniref:HAD domain-containing protein n=1 Tax=Herbidospora mongoliensis TaxID=688067 RepID=UPI0008305FDB|nr:HAD domain-containing protein [Herbidospora mongoliensis]